ncbi:MAG TPA: alkyl sulfatase dimerization domain-containing protein [Nannocystaceae bacterium]|nr:alkyl sulfatase dimerization domain-containing protein [Nannocystaceae bacterium]
MGAVLDLAEAMWNGTADVHVMGTAASLTGGYVGIDEVAPGIAFVGSFANVTAIATDDGLVLVDVGSPLLAPRVREAIRSWSDRRVHTGIYTHGHVDHVFGFGAYEEEAVAHGWPAPVVLAHEGVPHRFDRYKLTVGYNGHVNMRQFALPAPIFPSEFRYPDRTFAAREHLEIGGEPIEVEHARGETDDHAFVWLPRRRVLATGDLFIWAAPNCGNPQKVQRYPLEWAHALRRMAALAPDVLCPGHGPPILGEARIQQALLESAELLESLHEQTLALMNAGARLDDVLHGVRAPEHLLARPYLRPVYDEPEFIVRNLWRLYGGWYDGNPAHLKPAPERALARELALLCGGAGVLATRAEALAETGELALACHLAEAAWQAAPDDPGISEVRATIYRRRAEATDSLMARGIFLAAARESPG